MAELVRGVGEQPVLSIVVPLLNEEEVLEETYRRLTEELEKIGEPYEILFVDDGSTDGSRALLAKRVSSDPRVRVIGLARNFGHEMATTAGLHHARGQAAVIIDADLQDPPEVIADFVSKWREGIHVVYGVRQSREGESPLKKVTSFLFYRLMSHIADVPMPADTGDFRLLDRRVIDVFNKLEEDPRFFRGLVSWIGFRQQGIPFERQPRVAGQSKYRYNRLVKLAFDTITAFSTFPALAITLLAWTLAALSMTTAAVVVLLWVFGGLVIQPWAWVALGFLMLWNVQFLCVAVLGEFVVRTHKHVQRRPLYLVDAVLQNETPE